MISTLKKTWFQTVTWFWLHREKHRWKMNQIYRWLDTTKQNIHQRLNRDLKRAGEEEQLKVVLRQVREDHPELGCKALYRKVKPQTMGGISSLIFIVIMDLR